MKLSRTIATNFRWRSGSESVFDKMDKIFYRLCRDPISLSTFPYKQHGICPICDKGVSSHDFHYTYRLLSRHDK